MLKKPFFSIGKPRLEYPVIQDLNPGFEEGVPLPEMVTVYLDKPYSQDIEEFLKIGDSVKTGQKVAIDKEDTFFLSPVTGFVSAIDEYIGYLGVKYTAIFIKTDAEEQEDDEIQAIKGAKTAENIVKFLSRLPGCPDFYSFVKNKYSFKTIIIEGTDDDLLVTTNQAVVERLTEDVREGIGILKEITGAKKIFITAFPPSSSKVWGEKTAVIEIEPVYPGTLPQMVMKNKIKWVVPAGKKSEDLGVGFIKAEAVAALGAAVTRGKAPVEKIVTVIDKKGSVKNIKVRIGTPVKDILKHLNIDLEYGNRIVIGGPLRGKSIYTEDTPVLWDTDAILVQGAEDIVQSMDAPCVNCGECVRACPANIPVNMLVRLLENSLYTDAVQEYDLLSCIECGLCAYVCKAQIPIFHYIMLGKNEYLKLKYMEESNA